MRSAVNRFTAPIAAAILLAIYWPVAALIEDNFQAEILRSVQGTVMVVIFTAFLVKFRRAFGRDVDVPDSARRFYLGLLLWSSAASAGAWWRLMWRMGGASADLNWMLSNDGATFLLWVEIVGVFLMLSGPAIPGDKLGDMERTVPEDISWRRIAVAAVICSTVAYLLVVLRIGAPQVMSLLLYLHPR